MALPDLNAFCFSLPSNGQLCITMPGGNMLCAQFPSATPPSPDELANALLGNLNAALAPLTPIFSIIGLLEAIVDCQKAVEKCLGPPPNPTKLIQCFPNLLKALAKVLELLPQLTIPVMIAGIINALLVFLEGLRGQILIILNKLIRLLSVQIRIQTTGSVQLQVAADCASANLNAFLAGMSVNASPITCLLELINTLLDSIGLPELPVKLSIGVDPSAIEAFLIPLDDIIAVLKVAVLTFPVGGTC